MVEKVKLDLGCGSNKPTGYIGIDIRIDEGVDIICDCEKILPFKNSSIDEIRASHSIEHIHQGKAIPLMNEIWRILKPNGIFCFEIPDAERGQGAFQDLTHKSLWVKNSFKYFEISNRHNGWLKRAYGIKTEFKIEKLESVKYSMKYWGENYALIGYLRAVKNHSTLAKTRVSSPKKKSQFLSQFKAIISDDVCPSNLVHWKYWMWVKEKYPDLIVLCFVIANYRNRENVAESEKFKEWFEKNKDWVEIGIHGLDHMSPPECERENQEELITKALEILRPFLPEKFLFRPPGHQRTIHTEPILKKLGFAGIAYQTRIRYFDGRIIEPILNTHLSEDRYENPIGKIWSAL